MSHPLPSSHATLKSLLEQSHAAAMQLLIEADRFDQQQAAIGLDRLEHLSKTLTALSPTPDRNATPKDIQEITRLFKTNLRCLNKLHHRSAQIRRELSSELNKAGSQLNRTASMSHPDLTPHQVKVTA